MSKERSFNNIFVILFSLGFRVCYFILSIIPQGKNKLENKMKEAKKVINKSEGRDRQSVACMKRSKLQNMVTLEKGKKLKRDFSCDFQPEILKNYPPNSSLF